MHSLHSGKNAFRMHSLLKPRTKNQDFPKTPEQILVRTKTKNQEQRFPRANLGSNQNQEPRTKIPPGLLSKSWFEPKPRTKIPPRLLSKSWCEPRTKNQESRTKICSGVLGESWFLVLNLGFPKAPEQILDLRSGKECILNAFMWKCIHLGLPLSRWD